MKKIINKSPFIAFLLLLSLPLLNQQFLLAKDDPLYITNYSASRFFFSQKKEKENNSYIIDTIELKSLVFNNTRKIRILLPPGYHNPENSSIHYPVLYLNDGVAVFHAYNIEQTVHNLITTKKNPPIIIIGIDNGGATKESLNALRDRANEYLPWSDEYETNPALFLKEPQGKKYPLFLINEVIPLVNKSFRTKQGPENTALGGSSYGGLIALYTAINNTSIFGKLLLESPSLYINKKRILLEAENLKNWPKNIYIGIGTKEGETPEIQKMAIADAITVNEIIKKNGKKSVTKLIIEENGEHNFSFFAKRFPDALTCLFGNN